MSLNEWLDGIHLLIARALSDEVSYMNHYAVVHCLYFVVNVVCKYFIAVELT